MSGTNGLLTSDRVRRCWWPGEDALYIKYHDEEWGRPLTGDGDLFEKLTLDGFQAGLSWITILRKRENFRRAFDNFDFERIARYDARKVAKLLQDEGIIRHRGKIEGTVNNAKRAIKMRKEFGSLGIYFWSFEPSTKDRPKKLDLLTLKTLANTPASIAMSKDLRKRGWNFVGPTIIYAFMQAVGVVNDHIEGCQFRKTCEAARKAFKRPT